MSQIISSLEFKWGFPYTSPNSTEPSPYLYQIGLDHKVGPGILFHDCLVKIAEAHKHHKKGSVYSCYGSWIGEGVVWLIYPMNEANEREEALSDEQILDEAYGEEEGKQWMEKFLSTLISDEHKLLKYLPSASNPSAKKEETPMEYIYYSIIQLNEQTETAEYQELVSKVIQAHNQHDKGLNWVTYVEEGTDSRKLHLYVPMRSFGEMDNWEGMRTILNVFGNEAAQTIRDSLLSGVEDYKSYLMTFVPSCDNSGFEFVE
ncbi:hypothetical protein B7C51_09090 [Paenibacillus larvae subsp. pulvifaciens]|uniref:Uncharacterized protein n=1 Tax=Paenibacillus larvae subsp. pulvifaciens TaxID=1477 RepID=A0A1V0URP2_9BACL|nr:hypothetical protein [Paenibacillus larvae]ARF67949.1 hypothetical protein B7C51_09090 [Paenibacillus larvae subsp. pulvifaciens]